MSLSEEKKLTDKTEKKLKITGRKLTIKDKNINLNVHDSISGLHLSGKEKNDINNEDKSNTGKINILPENMPGNVEKLISGYAESESEKEENLVADIYMDYIALSTGKKNNNADSKKSGKQNNFNETDKEVTKDFEADISRIENKLKVHVDGSDSELYADYESDKSINKRVYLSEPVNFIKSRRRSLKKELYGKKNSVTVLKKNKPAVIQNDTINLDDDKKQEDINESDKSIRKAEIKLKARKDDADRKKSVNENEKYLRISKKEIIGLNNSDEENRDFLKLHKTSEIEKKQTQKTYFKEYQENEKKAAENAGVKEKLKKDAKKTEKESVKNNSGTNKIGISSLYRIHAVVKSFKDPDEGVIKFMSAVILKMVISFIQKIIFIIGSAVVAIITLIITIMGPVITVVICLVSIFAFIFGYYFGDYWVDTTSDEYISNYIQKEVHPDFMAKAKEYINAKDKYVVLYPVVDGFGNIIAFGTRMDKETEAMEKAYLAKVYAQNAAASYDSEVLNQYLIIDTDEEKELIKQVHDKMFYIVETDMYVDSVNESGENISLQVVEIFGLKLSGYMGKYSSELSNEEKKYITDFIKY